MKMTNAVEGLREKYNCSIWCDVVHATTAQTLAVFTDGYYAGSPSFTENKFGDGKAYYVATRPDKDFMHDFLSKVLSEQNIKVSPLPEEVELVVRSRNDEDYNFYMNHGKTEKQVKLPEGKYEDMLTGAVYENILHLAKYGVYILRIKERKS
jgi:beta-galactosidase